MNKALLSSNNHHIINPFTNKSVDLALECKVNDQNELSSPILFALSGFCHNIRVNKKMIFIVLRHETNTIQLIVLKDENSDVYDIVKALSLEATICVTGDIVKATVKTCTVTNYEVRVRSIKVFNYSKRLPFALDDANETFQQDSNADDDINSEITDNDSSLLIARCSVGKQIRFDNRWLDLRIPVNQHIFRLRSWLEMCIREQLISTDFMEIHTPKIIPAISEGGANVFDVNFFGKKVYLAQSPQLYKQMMINSGFPKVFEIGAIFRAENANTYRHLCEFTGFDMEFMIGSDDDHINIINNIWQILYLSFEQFRTRYAEQIDYVLNKTSAIPLIFPKDPLIIDFRDGVRMLNECGFEQNPSEDIGAVNEKMLGNIVKEKYNSDVYVLATYPSSARPFYTMQCDDNDTNSQYSKSFDFMMRGVEIASGAQRIHDSVELAKAIMKKGIELDGTSGLEDYVKSFETGSMPHGGCGIGLERLIMLILGLTNVRNTTLFPRDPKRITP
jgi:nondiscriminating aspartyl-tRNA synthetase